MSRVIVLPKKGRASINVDKKMISWNASETIEILGETGGRKDPSYKGLKIKTEKETHNVFVGDIASDLGVGQHGPIVVTDHEGGYKVDILADKFSGLEAKENRFAWTTPVQQPEQPIQQPVQQPIQQTW